MREQRRCMINRGIGGERIEAAYTREELDKIVSKLERRGEVHTKLFYQDKSGDDSRHR